MRRRGERAKVSSACAKHTLPARYIGSATELFGFDGGGLDGGDDEAF